VLEYLAQIVPNLAFGCWITQEVRWMKSRHYGDAPFVETKPAAKARDSIGESEQSGHGGTSQRDDDAWLEELKLSLEVG
jgi:hypothetical protein